MSGAWLLSWRHLTHHRVRSFVLVACLAVPLFLPVAASRLLDRFEERLVARAEATPLVLGARGNRFDLTLSALYLREHRGRTVPYGEIARILESGRGTPIPLHIRFSARQRPLVGTSPEYFELRRLFAVAGTLPLMLGDVVLGATVASELKLGPGDSLFSDPRELYDISKPPALKMHVCGVLGRTGGADDDAVFVDVRTTWVLEGLAHGHDAPEALDRRFLLGEAEGKVTLSEALVEYHEVTTENAASFHFHGEEGTLPLTAILVLPTGAKGATLLKASTNRSASLQMVVPSEVIDDLLSFVLRIKGFFDGFALVLLGMMIVMTGLVLVLSMRLRGREMETLHRIGCGRSMVARLYGTEAMILMTAASLVAGLFVGVIIVWNPDLTRLLS